MPEAWVQSEELLASVARLLRRLHTASAGFRAGTPIRSRPHARRSGTRTPPELVCHLDVTPQNVVVRDGLAVGLVDFDLAGPSTALRDSYNTALHWVPLRDPADAWPGWEGLDPFRRLRIFADAYGWNQEERRRVPALGIEAAALSYERMRHNAATLGGGWARMWDDGVGELILRRRGWLEANAGADGGRAYRVMKSAFAKATPRVTTTSKVIGDRGVAQDQAGDGQALAARLAVERQVAEDDGGQLREQEEAEAQESCDAAAQARDAQALRRGSHAVVIRLAVGVGVGTGRLAVGVGLGVGVVAAGRLPEVRRRRRHRRNVAVASVWRTIRRRLVAPVRLVVPGRGLLGHGIPL